MLPTVIAAFLCNCARTALAVRTTLNPSEQTLRRSTRAPLSTIFQKHASRVPIGPDQAQTKPRLSLGPSLDRIRAKLRPHDIGNSYPAVARPAEEAGEPPPDVQKMS